MRTMFQPSCRHARGLRTSVDQDWVERTFPGALKALLELDREEGPLSGCLTVSSVPYGEEHVLDRLILEGDTPGDDWVWCPEVSGWRREEEL